MNRESNPKEAKQKAVELLNRDGEKHFLLFNMLERGDNLECHTVLSGDSKYLYAAVADFLESKTSLAKYLRIKLVGFYAKQLAITFLFAAVGLIHTLIDLYQLILNK